MPDDVWLDRLTFHDGRSAALSGASYTDSGVYDFVGYLKQVPGHRGDRPGRHRRRPEPPPGRPRTSTCSSRWQTLPVVTKARSDMIEQALRRFLRIQTSQANRHSRNVCCRTCAGIAACRCHTVPDVTKRRLCSRSWIRQDRSPRSFETFESRVAEKLAQLKVFEARTVDEESLPALRGKLVDLAKETGCSIRRLSVGTASSRPWKPGDNPIDPTAKCQARRVQLRHLLLEWRPVSISLSGTSASLRTLLERIAAAGMLMHAKVVRNVSVEPDAAVAYSGHGALVFHAGAPRMTDVGQAFSLTCMLRRCSG